MKITDCLSHIESYSRSFCEVYKQYEYKDDDNLRDYLDFVIHEPSEWLRGFPTQWKTKIQFTHVRAAFHKLLKSGDIINELGEKYCNTVHEIIWGTFKKDLEGVLEKRNSNTTIQVSDTKNEIVYEYKCDYDSDHGQSIEYAQSTCQPFTNVWEVKYGILEKMLSELLQVSTEDNELNRLRRATTVLLAGFKHLQS